MNKSLECFDRARVLDPRLAQVHLNRGNALRDLGEFAAAEAAFRDALAIAPELAEAHYLLLQLLDKIPPADKAAIESLYVRGQDEVASASTRQPGLCSG